MRNAIAAIIMLMGLDLTAQEITAAPVKTMTFSAYREIIEQKIPEIKKYSLASERSKNAIDSAQAIEDFNLTGNLTWHREKPAVTSPSIIIDETSGLSAGVGVSKRITQTGTSVTLGLDYGQTRSIISSPTALDTTYYSPSLYVKLSQSILKNGFGIIDRYAEKNARMQYEIQKLREKENVKTTLTYYRKLYLAWIEYTLQSEILKKNVENSYNLYQQTVRKMNAGLADNDDVQRSLTAHLSYRQNHNQALTQLDIIKKEISLYVDITDTLPDAGELDRLFNEASGHPYAKKNFSETRLSEIYRLMKENYRYSREVAGNKLLPDLSIQGGVELNSQKTGFATAIENWNNLDYNIGFVITYPIGDHAGKSSVREADIALQEINSDYLQSQNSYEKNITTIIGNIANYRDSWDLRQQSLAANRLKLAAEQRKYQQSRISLSYIVDTLFAIAGEEITAIQLKRSTVSLYFDYLDLTQEK